MPQERFPKQAYFRK